MLRLEDLGFRDRYAVEWSGVLGLHAVCCKGAWRLSVQVFSFGSWGFVSKLGVNHFFRVLPNVLNGLSPS